MKERLVRDNLVENKRKKKDSESETMESIKIFFFKKSNNKVS